MPSAAELKAELRALRKESVKPVSRMKVADVAAEIQRLKGIREETPAPAATPSSIGKKQRPAVESIKEAKAADFPVQPDSGVTKSKGVGRHNVKQPKNIVPTAVEKSESSSNAMKAKLSELLNMM